MARTGAENETRAAKGGRARAAAMTASERSESARKAVKARWAKKRGQSAMSMSVSVGMPEGAQTHFYILAAPAKVEPLITMEVGSWGVAERRTTSRTPPS